MDSSSPYKNESAKAMANVEQTLQTMNDLYLLELSQALAQAVEAGMLNPILTMPNGRQRFDITFCAEHQMVVLPACPLCG